uniref:RGS domain-containing protein n=1 Tax=Octopus bimaculoides TaxID=37653 RepID=A0A0L8GAN3_OCTBM
MSIPVRRARPKVPPTYFREVFSKLYKEDFRRFLLKNRSVEPLQFLDMVSDINKIRDKTFQQYRVNQIWKKFFRTGNGNALQCSDRIIDLLSATEHVTAPFLKAAYPIVLKALENNWFKKYEESFYQTKTSFEQSLKYPKFELLMSFKRAWKKS